MQRLKGRSDVRSSSNVVRGFETASRASEAFRGLRKGFEGVRGVVGESGCDRYVRGSVMIVSTEGIFSSLCHSLCAPLSTVIVEP